MPTDDPEFQVGVERARRWEAAQREAEKVRTEFSKKLEAYIGKPFLPDSPEARDYHALVQEQQDAIRAVYERHGFRLVPAVYSRQRFGAYLDGLAMHESDHRQLALCALREADRHRDELLIPPQGADEPDEKYWYRLRRWCDGPEVVDLTKWSAIARTKKDWADKLHMDRGTLNNYIEDGRIRLERCGTKWRIGLETLTEMGLDQSGNKPMRQS